MKNLVNNRRKSKELTNSGHKKPFLSIDSELNVQELHKILLKNPYLVNTQDEKNETFLSYAIKRNNNPIINLILTSPILNLTYQNENGNTYLHLAVIQKNIRLVQILLDKGIFIDIQNNDGNTALHLAYYINNIEIIKILINNDVDFGIKNKKGLIAEEIEPTNNINEIAGYEVNYDFEGEDETEEINPLCLNQPEEFNVKKQNIDSNNSGETKYKSQFSKEKKSSKNKQTENGNSQSNDNRDKNEGNSLKIEDNNINNILLNELNDNNENENLDNYNFKKTDEELLNNDEIENDNYINNDIDKKNDSKTIINNYPLYEEPIETSQDIILSHLNNPKKINLSNFLDINYSNNNDNNSIHVNDFFLNDKGENQSLISNIPIKSDENFTQNNIKNNDYNKKEEKKEKIINCKNKSLYEFLLQISMQKYYDNLNNNGFEYINMIIDDTKIGNYLTDKQLKMIGINIPGDRAKILIRFEEKANLFEFDVPKSVYYINCNKEQLEDDYHVYKLHGWLHNIKLEQYIKNFVLNGYFSLDLLLVQSISKNPLTDEILKDEIGIEKLGHRARILNKLKEESKKFENKLRDSVVTFHTAENSKICSECLIY